MEERNFKAICTILASKGLKLNILESVFLTHTGISCWVYTDASGTFRKKNLIKSKVRTSQELLIHLIEDHRVRESIDPSIVGKLCWLWNSSTRRLLELSQIEGNEGKNASMIQVKLVQRYISNLHSNDMTYLLSMKYIDFVYVTKLHKLVNKERSPLKHPRIYNKALLVARLILQHVEEACAMRVLSLTCEFMLDKDGSLLLIHTTDCKLVLPEICLQLPIKSEADLASLKNLVDRRSSSKTLSVAGPTLELDRISKSSFKLGQLRNDSSFSGHSIPFKLDLESIAPSPEATSPDPSPTRRIKRTETMEMLVPLSYTDNWNFKMRIYSTSSAVFEKNTLRKKPSTLDLAPSKANLGSYNYADNINADFAEIIAKTFDKHHLSPLPEKPLAANKDMNADQVVSNLRKRYARKDDHIEETQNSSSSVMVLDLSAPKMPSKFKAKESPHFTSTPQLSPKNQMSDRLLANYKAKTKSSRYLSPSFIRSQASLALSPKSQLKRYKSPYLKKTR